MSLNIAAKDYPKEEEMAKILNLLADSFPYLKRIMLSEETFLADIKAQGFSISYQSILAEVKASSAQNDTAKVKKSLRIAKKKAALLIALADLSGIWELTKVTKALSDFASACLDGALSHLLQKYAQEGKLSLKNQASPVSDCGITVIGMGKLGAYELNYSSDIDLIYLFDAEKINYSGTKELGDFMIKFARELTTLIDERDKDGYAFRVDLRIRPDPLSTPIIMTVNAAENYYESFGQNWERAAMIKARPVAGDMSLGQEFIKRIYPFIWRRSLDFKTINDIKDIKKQISSRIGEESDFTPFGYNIKLGKGGIREIEFFVQVQQLIWGGRCKNLQVSDTLSALHILAKEGYISASTATDLQEAYIFLRNLEHRLQMINDEQTHTLPNNSNDLSSIATIMGFAQSDEFLSLLKQHLDNVSREFSKYFFAAKSTPEPESIILSSTDNQNENNAEITGLGFSNPDIIKNTILSWSSGLYTSTRSRRVQEVLPAVLPKLLSRISQSQNPDKCFYDFDVLLRSLPSGVQLIPLFYSRPDVMEIVIKIIESAPTLTLTMQKYPAVIEDLINPDFFLPLKDKEALSGEIQTLSSFESSLANLQLWVNSKKFQAGVHLLTGLASGSDIGVFISEVAAIAASKTALWLEGNIAADYGKIASGKISLLLLGRNGSKEASLRSDLDIIFIYDAPEEALSDGKKQLDIKSYYGRFAQRYINTLTSLGRNGKIWDVDMRLRPSGNSGPLATGLTSFIKYQKEEAWTWEHMALTKAKAIYGDLPLTNIIHEILSRKREEIKLKEDILAMRERIAKEHKPNSYLDVKNIAGGMTDIEFIAQYLQLAHAWEYPNILQKSTLKTLQTAGSLSLLSQTDADFLNDVYRYMLSLRALYELSAGQELSESLQKRLNTVAKVSSADNLKSKIAKDAEQVEQIFHGIFKA
ncbi:MAG: bifunctional [Alphaproteobacteria bacterium]|nr:bifunctional [glutamine synthetase] adenylyltransferase/[glutamine synthetase]-adenylyl-L-tyrosine phosphorylase [Alphaproteobacteria bacterium]